MQPVVLHLPLAPSVNHYWRSIVMGKSVRVLISKDGRRYKDEVKQYLAAGRFPHFGAARLRIAVIVHMPDRREADIENRTKALFDALSDEMMSAKDAKKLNLSGDRIPVVRRGLWRNDSQIDDYRITRGAVVKGGSIEMAVTVLSTVAQQMPLAAAA
jgi:crossover junction endodeoxyribonuclease RusA